MIHRYFFDMFCMFSIYLAADFGLGPFEVALLLFLPSAVEDKRKFVKMWEMKIDDKDCEVRSPEDWADWAKSDTIVAWMDGICFGKKLRDLEDHPTYH